ncbi:MAG TPA: hypothetical protein VJC11_02185 [Patescibacteria group bacterium]|nr:hypothetical protein [Patescibacteria group bacterium]
MRIKKIIYITSFTLVGFFAQLIAHALIETSYLGLLEADFVQYGFGLSWDQWYLIHHIGTIILVIVGFGVGFWQGTYWWKRIYRI